MISTWKTAALVAMAIELTGCAAFNTIESDVSTYSQWPQGRKPASYAFERLPSQQAQAQKQDRMEAAARAGLEAAGFTLAADPQQADVTVQIGVRTGRADISPYDDPFWWRGGLYTSRFGRRPFHPYYYGATAASFQFDSPRYEREAALLIRDRLTNKPLYEARATTEGNTPGNDGLIQIMFKAAMTDFPYGGENPRSIRIELPKR
jgi:hypothetical protein